MIRLHAQSQFTLHPLSDEAKPRVLVCSHNVFHPRRQVPDAHFRHKHCRGRLHRDMPRYRHRRCSSLIQVPKPRTQHLVHWHYVWSRTAELFPDVWLESCWGHYGKDPETRCVLALGPRRRRLRRTGFLRATIWMPSIAWGYCWFLEWLEL